MTTRCSTLRAAWRPSPRETHISVRQSQIEIKAPSWRVLRTMTGAERSAASVLIERGFDVYLPQAPQFTSGKDHAVEAPLFPGYLFARGPFNQTRCEAISSLPGVIGWIRFDGAIPTIPAETVADLMRRVDSLTRSGGIWRKYAPGERVSVSLGTLDGTAEVLESAASPGDKVDVLLRFMGQQVRASVPWSSMSPARSPASNLPHPAKIDNQHRRRRTRGRGRRINYVEDSRRRVTDAGYRPPATSHQTGPPST